MSAAPEPKVRVFYALGATIRAFEFEHAAVIGRASPQRRARFERRVDPLQRSLEAAALRLLEVAMDLSGERHFRLCDVSYPEHEGVAGKPYWRDGVVDFSLSHAHSIVICAIGVGCRVGVDAELRRDLDPRIVKRLLPAEAPLLAGIDAANAISRWTFIEAVLKGAGLGVLRGHQAEWRMSGAIIHGREWYAQTLDVGPDHAACVAVDSSAVSTEVISVRKL